MNPDKRIGTTGSAGGDEHERLLDEQVSYYRAIAADYLDQGPDLPGGGEVIEGRPSVFDHPPPSDDGTSYRLVKVPHTPPDLEQRLRQLGWNIKVTATSGPFYWGAGSRA